MTRARTLGKSALHARFSFADTAFPGGIEVWNSQLRFATGIPDGEHYLLRLFKKTGTALDGDLKRLITRVSRLLLRLLRNNDLDGSEVRDDRGCMVYGLIHSLRRVDDVFANLHICSGVLLDLLVRREERRAEDRIFR
jgi:hypothetical protein